MNRRNILKSIASAGFARPHHPARRKGPADRRKGRPGLSRPKIKDITVIETAPAGVRLDVVKIITDQDGLYGYGCATFTQRADLVKPAVERYLKPFLIGNTADRIEDIWQTCYDSSYWRNGPVLNNAISGVDQALWDIKGRQAGMPVYELLGGKCREAADCLRPRRWRRNPADASTSAKRYMAQGFRNVRVQVGVPGMAGYGAARQGACAVKGLHDRPVFEPLPYIRRALKLFEGAASNSATKSDCCTTCMSASRPTRPCNSARSSSNSSCSSWKIRSRPKTSSTSARSASNAPLRSPWASSSTARTNGRR